MPSPPRRISLLLPVVFELLATLLFLDYNFLPMSHFFACFLGAVQCPPPLLRSWAVAAGGERFLLYLPLCAHGRAGCQAIHSEVAGAAHRVLQALHFGRFYFILFFSPAAF